MFNADLRWLFDFSASAHLVIASSFSLHLFKARNSMSKTLLYPLFAFFLLHATISNAAACYRANAVTPIEDNCNLPAPGNLIITAVTKTSSSFAWAPVAGSNGYMVLLIEVATCDPIYSDHPSTESVNITGLSPDTEYEIKVWSVCPDGTLGGCSAIIVRTDYVIVKDIVIQREFNNEKPGLNFPLYADDLSPQPNELFKIKAPNGEFTLFESEKNTTPVRHAFFIHHPEFKHENKTIGARAKWILGVTATNAPFGSKEQNIEHVNVYHNQGTQYEPVMTIWCDRHPHNGASSLRWAPLVSGYELVKNDDDKQGSRKDIAVWPNPFRDNLVLHTQDDQAVKATVSLIEPIAGRVLFQVAYAGDQLSLPVAHLSTGSYIVRYESPTATQSFKVIKTNGY
jgi:hypothetical protein